MFACQQNIGLVPQWLRKFHYVNKHGEEMLTVVDFIWESNLVFSSLLLTTWGLWLLFTGLESLLANEFSVSLVRFVGTFWTPFPLPFAAALPTLLHVILFLLLTVFWVLSLLTLFKLCFWDLFLDEVLLPFFSLTIRFLGRINESLTADFLLLLELFLLFCLLSGVILGGGMIGSRASMLSIELSSPFLM